MIDKILEPGIVVRYDGRLATVEGIAEGRTLILRYLDGAPCATCGRPDETMVLEHSRLWQEHAEPVATITRDGQVQGARS